jgi:hypothetical protein
MAHVVEAAYKEPFSLLFSSPKFEYGDVVGEEVWAGKWAGKDSNLRRLSPTGLQPASFGHSDTDPEGGYRVADVLISGRPSWPSGR